MTVLSRRGLLTASSAAGLFAQEGEKPSMHSPDADLIRLCTEHANNLRAWLRNGGALEPEECPWFRAYLLSREAITASRPQSLAGLVEMARAAMIEATELNGAADPEGTRAENWSWNVVQGLLHLEGRA